MSGAELIQYALQFGFGGLVIALVGMGIATDRIYFRRDIEARDRLWQARVDAAIEERDRALRSADNATALATSSAEKLTEILALVRTYLPGMRA